jgi:hypothetical protein
MVKDPNASANAKAAAQNFFKPNAAVDIARAVISAMK